jgi:hypothetical protein
LELIKLFAPGADPIPPDAVIEGESLEDLPTILHKCGQIEVAIIEVARLALGIARRRAKQEVRKVEPGFGTIEGKTSIEDHVWMRVDLVRVDFAACLQSVFTHDARKRIADFINVLRLHERGCVHTHCEVIESDVLDAFGGRFEGNDPGEALRRERWAHAAFGLADRVGIRMKLRWNSFSAVLPKVTA